MQGNPILVCEIEENPPFLATSLIKKRNEADFFFSVIKKFFFCINLTKNERNHIHLTLAFVFFVLGACAGT